MPKPSFDLPPREFSDRVRTALKDTLYQRRILNTDVVRLLWKHKRLRYSPQRIGRILSGESDLRLDDLWVICDSCGLNLVDLVREPGRELVADLAPSELAILQALRESPAMIPPILQLLGPHRAATTMPRKRAPLLTRKQFSEPEP